MKKEEFFDTLEDVEQKYISEAFFDDLDDSLGVAKPGKAKYTPLKILAPIAACMAVVIGTGVVASRLSKLDQSEDSDQQSVQGELTVDPNAFIQVDFEGKDLKAVYDSNTIYLNFDAEEIERDFIAECISIIKEESESAQQDGVSWHVSEGYAGCGLTTHDYFFQPQIDGHGLADVGVRVFHKTRGYSSVYGETFDIADHGSFALDYEELDFDYVINHFEYNDKYYYRTDTIGSAESVSLREIMVEGNKDEIVEKTILEKIADGDTITYLHDGKKISEEEFIGTWNTYPFIPKFYTEFTDEEVEECREALRETCDLPDDWCDCWREAEVDIDLDGTKELLLSPQVDCYSHRYWNENMGVYVFARTSDGIKEVGSFETEEGLCRPEEIWYRNISADEYFPYYVAYHASRTNSSYAIECFNKILVDENGNITTEAYAEWGERIVDLENEKREWEQYFLLNGEEVSQEEYDKATKHFKDYEDHTYSKPLVPTDPNNYAWD